MEPDSLEAPGQEEEGGYIKNIRALLEIQRFWVNKQQSAIGGYYSVQAGDNNGLF